MDQTIASLDLTTSTYQKLKSAGYVYVRDVSDDIINRICATEEWAKATKAPDTRTALDLLERDIISGTIYTFNPCLDEVLEGEFIAGNILELCGEAGSGKTQICFQLCVNVQLPELRGGKAGEAVYICSNYNFSSSRLKEIAASTINKISLIPQTDRKLKDLKVESFMNGIHYFKATTCEELFASIVYLRSELKNSSQENLTALYQDEDFSCRIITGDETWIYHWDPSIKQESMQWILKGSPPPKRVKKQFSAGKVKATVFWDTEGILLIEYMPKGTTITRNVYKDTIRNLKATLSEKRPQSYVQKTMLLHDNCRVHKTRIIQDVIKECGFEELQHLPYSRFLSNDDLENAVELYFAELPKEFFFFEGIALLEKRSNKCIRLMVIDSISAILDQVDYRNRQQTIYKTFSDLQALGNEHNFSIVVTNSMTTRIRSSEDIYVTASFGDSFFHRVNARIYLKRKASNNFEATVLKSVCKPEVTKYFQL